MAYSLIPLINAARSNPDRVGASIYSDLGPCFNGKELTAYGVSALEQLNNYMRKLHPTSNLAESPALNQAAQTIANEKGSKGDCTHQKPRVINEKVQANCKMQGKVGELISLATNTPQETLNYFLIDDGLMSRKRRRMLFDPQYKYIGVGTSQHSVYGTITVILLAESITQ